MKTAKFQFILRPGLTGLALLWLVVASGRAGVDYNFNPGWKLQVGDPTNAAATDFDDTGWKPVTLPQAWNEDSAFKVAIQQLPTGVAWYRKHFKLPAEAAGKKVFIEFQGIRQAGEVYLNGRWIGRSENGVMAFGLDITDTVKAAPAENVMAVRTDNDWRYHEKVGKSGFEWNDRNFYANYGGINKNVRLHVTDRLHQTLPLYSNLKTTGVYVYGTNYDLPRNSAMVTAEAQVRNEYGEPKTFRFEATITDAAGQRVQTIEGGEQTLGPGETKTVAAGARVGGLHFWSWGYGYLYTVTTTLKVDGVAVDSVVTRTGFRQLEFGHGMVKLNGRVIHLKGYAQRSTDEWPGVGCAIPPWLSDWTESMMVEGNANLVRWMHVTPGKQTIEACDRAGLMESMPAGDSEKDGKGRSWELRAELMRDAIIYNRNNPSICFYEAGNNDVSEAHMAQMKALRDEYDPHGGRASGSRNMLASQVAEYGGEMLYVNKSAGKPRWMMEYERDEGLRKYWDNWSPPFHQDGVGPVRSASEEPAPYNRNQDSHAVENVRRWYDYWAARPGTGDRVNAGGVKIYFSDSNTHFRGETDIRCSGAVDALRLPKDGFYADQVMWDGWVNPETPRIHILGHWNYGPQVVKPEYVVSSADRVELFLNGQSKGFGQQSSHFLFTWPQIAFQPGELKAVGYDFAGKELCECALQTVGEPVALRLTPHTGPGGWRADGADLALADVEVVDAAGRRCPTALNRLHFNLQGPAEWRGGMAVGPDNYILAKDLPVECGVNRVILRSAPVAGKVLLRATAEGLQPAELELDTVPFAQTDGLATQFPDVGLTGRLGRGPTPAGDSIVWTRVPLRIASATAGSNPELAAQSYDDNEATSWRSDGQRGSGWIQFNLAQPAVVDQMDLKLGSFRRKSYPLRVAVDGTVVWQGNTPQNLGYTTLQWKPLTGRTVRVELAGAIADHDAFGLVEVTGKKLTDAAPSEAKGVLEIIEAELYGPVIR